MQRKSKNTILLGMVCLSLHNHIRTIEQLQDRLNSPLTRPEILDVLSIMGHTITKQLQGTEFMQAIEENKLDIEEHICKMAEPLIKSYYIANKKPIPPFHKSTIETLEDVYQFCVNYMQATLRLNFHADDPAEDYVIISCDVPLPTFSAKEAAYIDDLLQQCFNVCNAKDVDIHLCYKVISPENRPGEFRSRLFITEDRIGWFDSADKAFETFGNDAEPIIMVYRFHRENSHTITWDGWREDTANGIMDGEVLNQYDGRDNRLICEYVDPQGYSELEGWEDLGEEIAGNAQRWLDS